MIVAARHGASTFNAVRVPIVFVPGVMGSRVELTDTGERWDPDSKGAMLHWFRINQWQARDELHADRPGEVMDTPSSKHRAPPERGWEGVAWGFYGDFLAALDEHVWPSDRKRAGQFRCPVYACGYDWRQSNTVSAGLLRRFILGERGVLAREGCDDLVLVTHSMGGLVTRRALQKYPELRSHTRAVIHTVQPAVGATVAYRRFVDGATWPRDGGGVEGYVLTRIMGNRPWKYAALMSGVPGPMQLLPTNHLRDSDGQPWLRYRKPSGGTGDSSAADVFDLYLDRESPPGILNYRYDDEDVRAHRDARWQAVVADLSARVRQARHFHRELGDRSSEVFRHDQTWSIFSSGADTDVAVQVEPRGLLSGGLTTARRPEGDETVPEASGMALFPGERCPAGPFAGDIRQYEVRSVPHADACHPGKAPDVFHQVVRIIEQALYGPETIRE